MNLKVITGGKESKVCKCSVCTKRFQSPEQGHASAFVWLTLADSAGFKTDEFDICGSCAGHLLIEIKSYIESRVGIKKR